MNVTENIPTLFSLQYLMILFRNDNEQITAARALLGNLKVNSQQRFQCFIKISSFLVENFKKLKKSADGPLR